MTLPKIYAVFALGSLALGGCASDRPVVQGLFDPGGMIYRADESEEWGSRSTVKVQPLEF